MFVISASEPLLIEDIWCNGENTHIISQNAQNHHEEFVNYICEHFDAIDPCNFYFFLIHDEKYHFVQIADYKSFIDKFKSSEVFLKKDKIFKHLQRGIYHFQIPFINKLDKDFVQYINEDGTFYNDDNTLKLLHEKIFGYALEDDTCFNFSIGSCIIHGELILERGKTFFTKLQNILACKKIPRSCGYSAENDFVYTFWEKILTGYIEGGYCEETPGCCEEAPGCCEETPGCCEETPGCCEEAPGFCEEAPGCCEPNGEYGYEDILQDTETNPIRSFQIEHLQTMEIISMTEIEIDYDIPEYFISRVKVSSCCEDCNYCLSESNTHKFRICGSICFKKFQAAMSAKKMEDFTS